MSVPNFDYLESKIIICIGSGGVGKTSVSASLGLWAAEHGKKTLVLTVDPAKRLATTLNIKDDGNEYLVCKTESKGELWASVLNSKLIFDTFLEKAAAKGMHPHLLENLTKNKLYQQLSTTLSGSQEFTAIEKLYSCHKSGLYDLIILDTPPTQHAIDFLEAPRKISQLFSESIHKWFQSSAEINTSFWGSLFQSTTTKILNILQVLTGSDFVTQLRDFFMNVSSIQKDLFLRSEEIQNLLFDKNTVFNLVTAFDKAKITEANNFAQQLQDKGYHLKALTINRSFPEWLPEPSNSGSTADLYCQKLNKYYKDKLNFFDGILFDQKIKVVRIPEFSNNVADLDGLKKMVQYY